MENNLQEVFNYEGTQVRTTIIDGQPWFVAKDVCAVLGISAKAVSMHMKKLAPEMKCLNPIYPLGFTKSVLANHVNEAGLNMLIIRSDKAEAVKFQQWIASEVLPSIRRNGMYLAPEVAKEAIENQEIFLARAVLVANEMIEKQKQTIAQQADTISKLEPKAKIFDQVMNRETTYTVTDVAFFNNIASGRLFSLLCQAGWMTKPSRGSHQLTGNAPDGVFKIIKTMYGDQIRVTVQGKQVLDKLIKGVMGA